MGINVRIDINRPIMLIIL